MPTVLTVDDEANIRLFVKVNLMARGMDVIEAESVPMALEQLKTAFPDVILLDIAMPEVNGWQFLNQIADDGRLKDIPVILLTGTVEDEHPFKADYANIVGHLTKPVATQQLINCIAEVLQKRQ